MRRLHSNANSELFIVSGRSIDLFGGCLQPTSQVQGDLGKERWLYLWLAVTDTRSITLFLNLIWLQIGKGQGFFFLILHCSSYTWPQNKNLKFCFICNQMLLTCISIILVRVHSLTLIQNCIFRKEKLCHSHGTSCTFIKLDANLRKEIFCNFFANNQYSSAKSVLHV